MINRKQAYALLELPETAGLDEVKHAYRRLAFALHPDLNPDKPDASSQFQRLNEAYVYLCDILQPRAKPGGGSRYGGTYGGREAEETAKARAEANRAYKKAQSRMREERAGAAAAGKGSGARREAPGREPGKNDVLRDLLRDPFARRVFEDIYSQIRFDSGRRRPAARSGTAPENARARSLSPASSTSILGKAVDGVQTWLRRQIDEEQTVRLPGAMLTPGARVRLQITHGLSNKPQTIEVTLPPEFQPGRPIRLKGLGRRFGAWKGDLYLRIIPG